MESVQSVTALPPTARKREPLFSLPNLFTEKSLYDVLVETYRSQLHLQKSPEDGKDTGITRVALALTHWLLNSEAEPSKPGLFFFGCCGTGKTTWMRTLRSFLIDPRNGASLAQRNAQCRQPIRQQIVMVSPYDLYSDPDFNPNDTSWQMSGLFSICRGAGLLILDDVGYETPQNFFGSKIDLVAQLIEFRYILRLPVFLTSNLTHDLFRSRYSDRVFDRVKEMCMFCLFDGDSYRKETFLI